MGSRVGALALLIALAGCDGPSAPAFDRDAGEDAFWHACGDAVRSGFIVSTPSELEALAGATVIDGDLTITGAEVDDLSPLASVRCVRGRLDISDTTRLADLAGLERLVAVEDGIDIQRNQALTSVEGLSSLRFVGPFGERARLSIVGHPRLAALTGLDALEEIGGDLTIQADDALRDLHGLGGLVAVGGDLSIARHASLRSTEGLDALATVGGQLVIEGDDALEEVILPALRVVDDAPEDITGIRRGLEIAMSAALTRVTLRRLAHAERIQIHDVPALAAVDLQGLVIVIAGTRLGGHLEIDSPALLAVDLSSLETLEGDLRVTGRALDGLAAPRLTSVGGDLLVGDDTTFPPPSSESVSTLDLRSLETVGGAATIRNTELGSLEGLAALRTVGGDLAIEENSLLLTLGLDALVDVGGSLDVRSNRQLPTCAAEALEARLRAAGWDGRVLFAANDDSGTCP